MPKSVWCRYVRKYHSPPCPLYGRAQKRPATHEDPAVLAAPSLYRGWSLTWMFSCLSCRALWSSRRLPLRVLSFTASCSASSFVWALPSSSRLSLWTESSDRATTFCSISTSMFWDHRNKGEIHTPFRPLQRPFPAVKSNTSLCLLSKNTSSGLFPP